MTTTVIPCKQPKVTIEAHERRTYSGRMALYHLATCHVPGCGWTYDAAVVTDAQQQATWHRGHHRAAVPDTAVLLAHDGHQAECDCGEKWTAPTKAHARTWLRHHLELDHGLVVCP